MLAEFASFERSHHNVLSDKNAIFSLFDSAHFVYCNVFREKCPSADSGRRWRTSGSSAVYSKRFPNGHADTGDHLGHLAVLEGESI